jgi:DNA-directed RNA polymerase subunit E"
MEEVACKTCRIIIKSGNRCPLCGSTDITPKWSGYIIMLNPEKSEIAKKLNININSTFALNIKS